MNTNPDVPSYPCALLSSVSPFIPPAPTVIVYVVFGVTSTYPLLYPPLPPLAIYEECEEQTAPPPEP